MKKLMEKMQKELQGKDVTVKVSGQINTLLTLQDVNIHYLGKCKLVEQEGNFLVLEDSVNEGNSSLRICVENIIDWDRHSDDTFVIIMDNSYITIEIQE